MNFNLDFISRDSNLLLAIIAINMTIIGLTSLAETKQIMGVDYGKFLIRKYKVFYRIKIYYFLIFFALINVASLISLFSKNEMVWRINIVVLILSLVFAIYYFFAYILTENKDVKRQIFIQELVGLYYDSIEPPSFIADRITGVHSGSRSHKKLSSNIITYFNIYNSETQAVFEEAFGPKSIIYQTKKLKIVLKKQKQSPYIYRDEASSLNNISHEFFQLYRSSELQEKWLMEIIRLFNNEYTASSKEMRLNNIIRVLAHINAFGFAENLFKYKFLDYITVYIDNILIKDAKEKKVNQEFNSKRIEKEMFFFEQLSIYIFKSLNKSQDATFMKSSETLFEILLNNIDYNGVLSLEERVSIIIETGLNHDNLQAKKLMFFIINHSANLKNSTISINTYKKKIQDKNKQRKEYEDKLEAFFQI